MEDDRSLLVVRAIFLLAKTCANYGDGHWFGRKPYRAAVERLARRNAGAGRRGEVSAA